VLRAQIVSPAGVLLELHVALLDLALEEGDGVGVGDAREVVLQHVEQAILEALLARRVLVLEVVQVVGAVLERIAGAELHVILLPWI
jgi:hypothetical protein